MKQKIAFCAATALAGIVNGLLGTGGGIILIFAFQKIFKVTSAEEYKNIFALTIASIFPMSLLSAYLYFQGGHFSFSQLWPYVPGAVLGGITGGFLLSKIKPTLLKKIFSFIVIYAGIRMFF